MPRDDRRCPLCGQPYPHDPPWHQLVASLGPAEIEALTARATLRRMQPVRDPAIHRALLALEKEMAYD